MTWWRWRKSGVIEIATETEKRDCAKDSDKGDDESVCVGHGMDVGGMEEMGSGEGGGEDERWNSLFADGRMVGLKDKKLGI